LSRLLAVAMTLKPRWASTAELSSGIGSVFSDNTVIRVSCTSEPMRVSSSSRTMVPSSMARISGVGTSASRDGPLARSSA